LAVFICVFTAGPEPHCNPGFGERLYPMERVGGTHDAGVGTAQIITSPRTFRRQGLPISIIGDCKTGALSRRQSLASTGAALRIFRAGCARFAGFRRQRSDKRRASRGKDSVIDWSYRTASCTVESFVSSIQIPFLTGTPLSRSSPHHSELADATPYADDFFILPDRQRCVTIFTSLYA